MGRTNERGQVTFAMIGVVALTLAMAVALATFGAAVLDRAKARNAADSVALAAAVDPAAADWLAQWYDEQGVTVEVGERTVASRRSSQAAAWAHTVEQIPTAAPVLVAIVARAEQLLDVTLHPRNMTGSSMSFDAAEASVFSLLAGELGMCPLVGSAAPDATAFELC